MLKTYTYIPMYREGFGQMTISILYSNSIKHIMYVCLPAYKSVPATTSYTIIHFATMLSTTTTMTTSYTQSNNLVTRYADAICVCYYCVYMRIALGI